MTPLASSTLFDRLLARTARPERAAAIAPATTPVFDPFDDALREGDIEQTSAARRSLAAAHDTKHAPDGVPSGMTANANDDEERRRMASESRVETTPRRPRIAPRARAIPDDAIAHPRSGAEVAGTAEGIARASGRRAPTSTSVIRVEAAQDDRHEPRQAGERQHMPHAATRATSRGERERLSTIRPPLDRWTTFDERSSPSDAAVDSRASARGTAAIVPPSIGRAASRAGEWPDEHSSVVQPDLPIAIPPRAHQLAAPAAAAQEPIVHVTIGRLEIRTNDRNTPQRSRERPAAVDAAAASLDQYLASRRGGAS